MLTLVVTPQGLAYLAGAVADDVATYLGVVVFKIARELMPFNLIVRFRIPLPIAILIDAAIALGAIPFLLWLSRIGNARRAGDACTWLLSFLRLFAIAWNLAVLSPYLPII